MQMRGQVHIDGAWVDVAGIREDLGVTMVRGRRDMGTQVERGKCTFKVDNRDGRWSELNPHGPYYGKLLRNTPFRYWVRGDLPYVRISSGGDRARVASTAALNVAGDLDVRLDLALSYVPGLAWDFDPHLELMGRYNTVGNQRMWRFLLTSTGRLALGWSTDGTGVVDALATVALPALTAQRIAVRAVLDVNNGAGGKTVRFYTAETIDGPWEQLGDDVVTAGTTSVNTSGTADLEVGDISTLGFGTAFGRFYAAQVLDGIDGTAVADVDFTAQQPGDTAFTDAAGRDWTLGGATAEVTDYYVRMRSEIPAWPQEWDHSARDTWVSIEAAGPLRRLEQSNQPVKSTLRNRIPSGDPLAYWPMEDGALTTRPASAVPGGSPLTVRGMTFAADSSLPASDHLPTLGNSSSLRGEVPGAAAGGWHTEMVYKLASMPTTERTMLRLDLTKAGSSVTAVRVRISTAGIRVQALDDDNNVVTFALFTNADAIADFTGVWNRLIFFSYDNGPSTFVCVGWRDVASNTNWFVNTSFSGNPGKISAVRAEWGSDFNGMAIGHLGVWDTGGTSTTTPGVSIYAGADDGFTGEGAVARIRRIVIEEQLPLTAAGLPGESEPMGPQRIATPMNIVRECEETDGGVLVETRDVLALRYIHRGELYNRRPALVLDQAAGELAAPLAPAKRDGDVRNEVVVTRTDGASSAPARKTDGPLAVEAIGLYDEEFTRNLARDEQTDPYAGWMLHLLTIDEARVPVVEIDLMNPRMRPMRQQILDRLESQALLVIKNTRYSPDDLKLIVEGYTEKVSTTTWRLTLNCSPASPWVVGVTDDPVLGKADTDGSVLLDAAGAADTTLTVRATAGSPWTTDPAEVPWDIRLGGEVATVTAVAQSIVDGFDRLATFGWGSAPTGQAWSSSGGSTSDYAVSSGNARHLCSTLSIARLSVLAPAVADDFDVYCKVGVVATSTGGSQFGGPAARYTDAANMYYVRAEFTTASEVILSLRKRTADVDTELASNVSGLNYSAGVLLNARFQGLGTELRGKVWPATAPEPRTWQVVATDTDHSTGQVGTRSIVTGSNTNVNPTLVYDDFQVVNPQVLTVTRAVNGVSKAHAAGTALALANPAIVAL